MYFSYGTGAAGRENPRKQQTIFIFRPSGPAELKITTLCLDSGLGCIFPTGLGRRVGKILENSKGFVFSGPRALRSSKYNLFTSIPVWGVFSYGSGAAGLENPRKQQTIVIFRPSGPEELKIKTVCLDSGLGCAFPTGPGRRVGKILEHIIDFYLAVFHGLGSWVSGPHSKLIK